MQDGAEKIELCIASADELILHPGVDVEEVTGVLPELENNSSSNTDNISTQNYYFITWRSAPCWRGEVGSSSQPGVRK